MLCLSSGQEESAEFPTQDWTTAPWTNSTGDQVTAQTEASQGEEDR